MATTASSMRHDFVIIGAGPAGAVIATRLANSPKKPSVLLIEAGGANEDVNNRMLTHKYIHSTVPGLHYDYKSEPNPHINGRCAGVVRGRGLGGSSAVNYSVWTEGAKADWDYMARWTGDDTWRWERVKERFNKLTTHHCKYPDVRPEYQAYIGQTEGNYGTSGPIHLGYPEEPEQEILDLAYVADACGLPFRPEANNGTMDGAYVIPDATWRGTRSTAADILFDHPDNLEIVLETPVARVLLEGERAVGVKTVDGRVFHADKEVIVCAGTMDSPKILMHSGIGPEDQLSKFGIPVARANANVGRNYQDHPLGCMIFRATEEMTKRPAFFRDEAARKKALRDWQLRRTGPYASIGGTLVLGFSRPEKLMASAELAALPEQERAFLSGTDTPMYELGLGFPWFDYFFDPQNATPTFIVFMVLQHVQGRGQFSLKSADPSEPLCFETGMFSHEFDRRHAIETTRHALALIRKGDFPKYYDGNISVPASESDEDILDFWRQTGDTCSHASSTCRMGRREVEDEAVVDTEFRVYGFRNLRVADNSIHPYCPSGHTQTHAYQVGEIAAEKLIAQYELK
ncbi:Oxygen-dependent choline dehydrogenase [Escovopsis weberi]|uniref:Oxygen-dependent choline dehydrogenase n=1 Tax=Escovopsis weberi TaxID=150374 RepID=A0A0M8N507_ESCWE|nr:Oxygen-dependent choline dehydrogenase [Escovopsis weberi]